MRDEQQPLISVAMCTYNGARFLEQQLNSIVSQTYSHLEIVIADDCSTDDTITIIRHFQQHDPRIRLVQGERNLGFIGNFARVLQECSGELIALADQDDIWFPEKIATLWRQIDDNLLIYSRVKMIDAAGQALAETFPRVNRLEGACALGLLVDNCVTGHACLIRRELLDATLPFPQSIKAHDQWLAIIAASSGRMKASDEVLSYYRKHDSNALLSSKKKRKISRFRQKMQHDSKLVALMEALDARNVLQTPDVLLLREFAGLLSRNRTLFFNWPLARFLKKYEDRFLALYTDKDKARRKLCRGGWYFRVVPFA